MIVSAGRSAWGAVVGAGVAPRVAGCAALASSSVPSPSPSLPGLARRWAHAGIGVDKEYGIPTVGLRECISGSGIAARMVSALRGPGFFVETGVLGDAVSTAMREDAVRLFGIPGRYIPSQSVGADGLSFDKQNVFACELDGHEWDDAPHLLAYTRELMTTLPALFNEAFEDADDSADDVVRLSAAAYGSKLAVALGGGSSYPKHVDNACTLSGGPATTAAEREAVDARQLTVIYYLNPSHQPGDGGQLRLWAAAPPDGSAADAGGVETVIEPAADTLVAFWSDTTVHDVMANKTSVVDADKHRYALTIWMMAESAKVHDGVQLCNRALGSWKAVDWHFPDGGAGDFR